MDPMILSIIAFVGMAFLGAGLMALVGGMRASTMEDRLDILAGVKMPESEKQTIIKQELSNLSANMMAGAIGKTVDKFNIVKLLEQSESPVALQTFLLISLGSCALGVAGCLVGNAPLPLYAPISLIFLWLPTLWLMMRRSRRFKKFGNQLPDALALLGRALRSGHSLNSGLHLVTTEMPAPISTEFYRAYEEQNLGIPIEQALKGMLTRMPNLDLKFFVTAVAIQRTSGGDLAEILDKICHVIRERFKILGTVQALTAEGRLSGVVLMAMPIAIFFAVYYLNPDYVMLLFTTELGKKMIGVAIVMQILGAICIKKIIDIKV